MSTITPTGISWGYAEDDVAPRYELTIKLKYNSVTEDEIGPILKRLGTDFTKACKVSVQLNQVD